MLTALPWGKRTSKDKRGKSLAVVHLKDEERRCIDRGILVEVCFRGQDAATFCLLD